MSQGVKINPACIPTSCKDIAFSVIIAVCARQISRSSLHCETKSKHHSVFFHSLSSRFARNYSFFKKITRNRVNKEIDRDNTIHTMYLSSCNVAFFFTPRIINSRQTVKIYVKWTGKCFLRSRCRVVTLSRVDREPDAISCSLPEANAMSVKLCSHGNESGSGRTICQFFKGVTFEISRHTNAI